MAEELIGYAVAMGNLPFDHTYVVTSSGHRWGCKGREYGGRIICRGSGRPGLALCLACSDAQAGIVYGVTGVCFQIANRILWPAAVLVERATGYNRLFRHFGHYGLDLNLDDFWPERHRCLDEIGGRELREDMARWLIPGLQEPEATAYVMQSDSFIIQSIERMNLLLDRGLGGKLDSGVQARVEQIVAATAARQRELVLALQRREIAPETYLDAFSRLVAADFRQIDEVLGREAFVAVFGAPPEVAAKLIDPDAFAAAHRQNQRG